MRTRGMVLLANLAGGLGLGYVLARIGFGDFGELNRMFTFQDLRMLFAFAGGVAVIAAVFLVARVRRRSGRLHAGLVPGAAMFGVGWAICGGCPAIPLVQLAEGYLPAVVTIAGIVVGVRVCRWVDGRWLRLDRGSCGI